MTPGLVLSFLVFKTTVAEAWGIEEMFEKASLQLFHS